MTPVAVGRRIAKRLCFSKLALCLAAILAGVYPERASAQLVPSDKWLTVETEHFRVHFTRPLESEARRGAVNAERAFRLLSTELHPPSGKVDLVIADNVDYVNGYATPFPSNRIVVFANPPVDTPELRNFDDWSTLVITHELAHIFHLDRAGGIWKIGRSIFGRHPVLFPAAFQPAWLVEGLAVYLESRLTGAGRLDGSEYYMIARAAAEANRFPRLGEISRETSRFPGGETVYAYGGMIFDHLSRTRGPKSVGQFVDIASSSVFPLSLNGKAKRAFGISFENAWRQWSDSLRRATPRGTEPMSGWRELTGDGRYVSSPQWLNDTALVYTAANGREVASAYSVLTNGRVTKLGRRNSLGPSVPLSNGGILFSQPDYADAFHFRNDLYIERDGRQTRLTRGARLSRADARKDGAIVAVQAVPGSTRIVRVSRDGSRIDPITTGDSATQWGEPAWSPDGSRIAVLRLRRGGFSDIVVLDTLGSVTDILISERAVAGSPTWAPDGARVFFTSDRSGITQVYVTAATRGGQLVRLTASNTGAFSPEPSPDARSLAVLGFRFDGYHLGVAPLPSAAEKAEPYDALIRNPRGECRGCRAAGVLEPPTAPAEVTPTRPYSPWRSLAPTYWEPIIEGSTETGTLVGAATSGNDIVGRHGYFVSAAWNTRYREADGYAGYRYGGFGQPFVNASAEQAWEHFPLFNRGRDKVGDLARRSRIYRVDATLIRPRARTFASFTSGGEVESRNHGTDPDTLLAKLPSLFGRTRHYPSVFASGGWSNTRRPSLSISREDGVSLSGTARQRWQSGGSAGGSRSVVGVAAGYKSLDLPGFAHHVLALRTAAGIADDRAITSFSVGGLSGGSIEGLSSLGIGDQRRTFGIRGFPPSAQQGIRAFSGSLEYRAPLAAPSRRYPYIPLLIDRISVSGFADAGRAYCPAGADTTSVVCGATRKSTSAPWLASVGGELNFDTAIQYDVPARLRAGVAVPVANGQEGRARSASFYLTFGSSF
ncbi:MAG: hypothetical protein WKF55_08505 [Gemmatimonadaceae bacterium]